MNLLPSDEVQDIYRLVAVEVIEKVKQDLIEGTEDSVQLIINEKTGEITERRELGHLHRAGWVTGLAAR